MACSHEIRYDGPGQMSGKGPHRVRKELTETRLRHQQTGRPEYARNLPERFLRPTDVIARAEIDHDVERPALKGQRTDVALNQDRRNPSPTEPRPCHRQQAPVNIETREQCGSTQLEQRWQSDSGPAPHLQNPAPWG